MTKKDYELVAKLIREGLEVAGDNQQARGALWRFTTNFASEVRLDNARFDRERFLTAAGFDTLKRFRI